MSTAYSEYNVKKWFCRRDRPTRIRGISKEVLPIY